MNLKMQDRIYSANSLKRKMASLAGVAIFLFMFLPSAGCGRLGNVQYSQFLDIESEGWDPLRYLEFSPWPMDSTRAAWEKYDMVICVRYSSDCHLRELPIRIETVSLSGPESIYPDTVTVPVPLYNSEGHRLGKGPFTVYEVYDTIARDVRLSQGYTVSLSNPLDASSTRGLTNIGLILTPSH